MSVWSGETWWNVVKRLCQTVCQSVCQLCDALCIAFVVNPAVRLLIGAWDAWPGGCSRWHGIWQRQRFKTNLSGNKKTCWINMLICIYILYYISNIYMILYYLYCQLYVIPYMFTALETAWLIVCRVESSARPGPQWFRILPRRWAQRQVVPVAPAIGTSTVQWTDSKVFHLTTIYVLYTYYIQLLQQL